MKLLKLCALSLLLASPLVMAQTSATAPAITSPTPATSTVTAGKLTTEFSGWAGSQENSAALVNGLRTGTPITLNEPGPAGTVTATTFSPTTKPMGYGNIRIALSLARAQLASQGIANPTTAELQAALVGTPDGMTQGVLQMRASGMGWGQIANSMGVKLGAVMSGKQTFATGTTTTATGTTSTTNAGQARKGVVTADGSSAGGTTAGKANVTSAAGGSGKVTTGLGHAYGHAGGAGVVNAGGAKAGGAAVSNAGGNAGGNGKGGGKP